MKLEQAARQALEALSNTQNALLFIAGNKDQSMSVQAINDADEAITALREALAEQAEQEPAAWQGAEEWERLAFQLCADESGEESCNELLWDGGVIPEPWGERWLKYEDEAKRMIEYVRNYAAPVRTKDLTDDELLEISKDAWGRDKLEKGRLDHTGFYVDFARAVIAKDREKNRV